MNKLPLLVFGQGMKAVFLFLLFVTTLFLFIGVLIVSQIPSRAKIRGCMTTEMFHVELCPGSKDYVPLKKISKYLRQAVVVTEDSAFWSHRGFDFQEMQKSFEKNLEKGHFARGGSTITQQLAKNLFLSSEKSIQRKFLEAIITLQIERNLSKEEILERYLNVVQFGKDLYGVKDAAQFYFKKSPANLDLIESAFLAFLLPSPEKYSVSFFKKKLTPFARQRLRQIVGNLYRYQDISAEAYQTAIARMDSFLVGGPALPIPEGLDLNAPEEDSEDFNLDLEPLPPLPDENQGPNTAPEQNQIEEEDLSFE